MRLNARIKRGIRPFSFTVLAILGLLAHLSCGGGGGGGGGGGSDTTTPANDTTAPVIAFTYPANSATFDTSNLPQYAAVAYSDASGVDPTTLSVTFTISGRTLSLTDLFGTDAVANSSSSRTLVSETNPLLRTSASFFTSGFSTPASVGTVEREGSSLFSVACVSGSNIAYAWNPADTNIYRLEYSGGALSTTPVDLTFVPSAVESASDKGKIYVARQGYNQLFVFSTSTGDATGFVQLNDEPKLLAYHAETGKLYISFKTLTTITRLDTTTGLIDASFSSVPFVPSLLETRRGESTEGVFAVGPSLGGFRLVEYDNNGNLLRNVTLALLQPSDMDFVTSGYLYLSNYGSNSVTRVRLSDNAKEEISVGTYPKRMFVLSNDSAYVINSGSKTITFLQGAVSAAQYQMSVLPLDGSSKCSSAGTLLIEDVWSLDNEVPVTLTATVKDKKGNTGITSITIHVRPASAGGV